MVQANGKVRDRLEVPGPADGESMASQLAAVKKAPSAEGVLSIFGAWQKKSAFSNSLKTLRYKRMREAVLSSFCA